MEKYTGVKIDDPYKVAGLIFVRIHKTSGKPVILTKYLKGWELIVYNKNDDEIPIYHIERYPSKAKALAALKKWAE